MNFNHSTPAQNIAALRERFRQSSGLQTARIARWIYNNLTLAQIKAAFGLTDAQVATLRAKFLALRDKLNDIDAAGGE